MRGKKRGYGPKSGEAFKPLQKIACHPEVYPHPPINNFCILRAKAVDSTMYELMSSYCSFRPRSPRHHPDEPLDSAAVASFLPRAARKRSDPLKCTPLYVTVSSTRRIQSRGSVPLTALPPRTAWAGAFLAGAGEAEQGEAEEVLTEWMCGSSGVRCWS